MDGTLESLGSCIIVYYNTIIIQNVYGEVGSLAKVVSL